MVTIPRTPLERDVESQLVDQITRHRQKIRALENEIEEHNKEINDLRSALRDVKKRGLRAALEQ